MNNVIGILSFWICAQDCYFWEGSRISGHMPLLFDFDFAEVLQLFLLTMFFIIILGADPIYWCWDCSFSKRSFRWQKYSKAYNFYMLNLFSFPLLLLNLSCKHMLYLIAWQENFTTQFPGTCFQNMLVLAICASHIQLTPI